MIGTGIGSAVVTAGYAVAAIMAIPEDVELPSRVGSVCLTLILGFALMSFTTWLAYRAQQSRNELADAIADRLAVRLDGVAGEAAEKAHSRTVAAFREIVTGELVIEQLNAAVKRIHRLGMITEAKGQGNVSQIRRN